MINTIIFILSLFLDILMTIVNVGRLIYKNDVPGFQVFLWALGIMGVVLKILKFY